MMFAMSGLVRILVSMCWLLSARCLATFITGEEAIGSPLRVAQCRAQCLQTFSNGLNRESTCLQGPDCFMVYSQHVRCIEKCWEHCELLQSNFPLWGAMCSEKGICFPGCQQACRFHRETASKQIQQSQPVIHTRGEEVIKLNGALARWPRPPTTSPSNPLVYVVMRRQPSTSSSWRQVAQTVDLTAKLPSDNSNLEPPAIRVLVVDPEGLVTIYSPTSPTSGSVAPSVSLASDVISKVMAGHRKKINTEVTPTTTKSPSPFKSSGTWELREVSLIHQKVLVIAEIAWEPRVTRGVYLVTWEVDGGGLKGNLFTDSTCVTLSLWPDTVYHIQVELVSRTSNHQAERSEGLVIDTHRAPYESTYTSASSVIPSKEPSGTSLVSSPLLSVLVNRAENTAASRQQMEMLAGTGTAVLLFLVVVGALAWRCRRYSMSSIASKKLIEDVVPICRPGFHPIVTMMGGGGTGSGVGRSQTSGGITNPLLQEDQSEDGFLKEAERSARNEVQV